MPLIFNGNQPSGTMNFSTIKNAYLNCNLYWTNALQENMENAVNYNILKRFANLLGYVYNLIIYIYIYFIK